MEWEGGKMLELLELIGLVLVLLGFVAIRCLMSWSGKVRRGFKGIVGVVFVAILLVAARNILPFSLDVETIVNILLVSAAGGLTLVVTRRM